MQDLILFLRINFEIGLWSTEVTLPYKEMASNSSESSIIVIVGSPGFIVAFPSKDLLIPESLQCYKWDW
jgi:hypothetical protein